ncbi:MAG TPA: P1 family peptidase [Bacillota bacterium]|jgi:L-aminopeptidase/D-esterase-like protein|nr:peptidase [Clostridiales bacterium UBA9856]HOA41845.1 P1 family peptidase [Bacillota bacterium]HPZ59146.1 P1 family peptidase [Bacillota bacterium]HQC82437.1 P1 family peptidase [Bacillota bacterium]
MKEVSITDIKGIKVGHAQDVEGGTGCTVILCEEGAYAGVDVRGGGPASRETELLKPVNLVEQIHAVMLSGGSAYGLDAASGAMQYLEENGKGFDVGIGVVPIVCGASLFDLVVGDPKCRPDKAMGYQACLNASSQKPAEGNVGAGTGATVGKFLGMEYMMKSGLGTYAVQMGEWIIGAIVAVNALGDVIDVDTGKRIAGILNKDKTAIYNTEACMYEEYDKNRNVFSGNTTIGCVVTNAKLTKTQANKVASIAHNGFARAIRPVHTMADGDTIFVLATGEEEVMPDAVGALAAEVMARAINRAVYMAEPAYGLKAAKDFL